MTAQGEALALSKADFYEKKGGAGGFWAKEQPPQSVNLLNLFRHPKQLVDLTPAELEIFIQEHEAVLVDVRTPGEYHSGHIKGAQPAPLGTTASQLSGLDRSAPVVLICKTGHRSQAAARELIAMGFTSVHHLKGGMDTWKRGQRAVDKP